MMIIKVRIRTKMRMRMKNLKGGGITVLLAC